MIEQGTLLNFVGGSWQRVDATDGIAGPQPGDRRGAVRGAAVAVGRDVDRAVERGRTRRCRRGGARRPAIASSRCSG